MEESSDVFSTCRSDSPSSKVEHTRCPACRERCKREMALGFPVEPDENITVARFSPVTRTSRAAKDSAAIASFSVSRQMSGRPSRRRLANSRD